MLQASNNLVSVDWLLKNIEEDKLVILNCTIKKVTGDKITDDSDKNQIKGAVFFDIKNVFSDKESEFPNTVLLPEKFEHQVQKLGINKDSFIVCYDNLGVYSSPRVWWMFQLMGFKNVAVLNGSFSEWEVKKYPIEEITIQQKKKGDFKVDYQPKKLKFTKDVLSAIENQQILIADARSKGRFLGTEPEPRSDVKSGHIPNSVSFSYSEIIENGKLKPKEDLVNIFNQKNPNQKDRIHPTQKSVSLYQWLLKNYAKKGDKILDTHLGSMSIAIAVDSVNKIEGMDLTLTGCELDADYFKEGIARVERETKWESVFKEPEKEVEQIKMF